MPSIGITVNPKYRDNLPAFVDAKWRQKFHNAGYELRVLHHDCMKMWADGIGMSVEQILSNDELKQFMVQMVNLGPVKRLLSSTVDVVTDKKFDILKDLTGLIDCLGMDHNLPVIRALAQPDI